MSVRVSIILFALALADVVYAKPKLDDAMGNLQRDVVPKTGVRTDVNIAAYVGELITVALTFVGTVFLILMLYSGFRWMSARGDETKATKARNTISDSAIGLAIVVAAYVATRLVFGLLT